ncbi:LAFA_0E11452g1_1 [Lachancea sp. 'fantastica']|nr:LAFA_0E11452g1_1 [Lachancea sp. 'fantastica']
MGSKADSTKDSQPEQQKEDENRERLKRLGMQCVSPGFGKMDNRMLSTIQLSRDIAKDQKEAIHKLSTRQTETFKNNDSDDEVVPKQVEQTNQDVQPSSLDSTEQENHKRTQKSLKRGRVPPPLNIGSSGANGDDTRARAAHFHGSQFLGAKSAPAHITRYPRGKSRVQYLGRTTSKTDARIRKKPRANSSWPFMMNPPFTPYGYYQMPQTAAVPYHMGYGSFQNAYQAPYMMTSFPYAMMQTPFADPSSAPTRTLQQDFDNYRSQNPGVGTRDLFGNNESRWAPIQAQPQSARNEFFGSRTMPNTSFKTENTETQARPDNISNGDESDNEDADLAIEEGAEPNTAEMAQSGDGLAGVETLHGELRLHNDNFGFSFALLEAATDKKMFMSICDKVWDDFQALARRE